MSGSNPITYDQMKDLLTGQASTFASALRNTPGGSSPGGSGGASITGANAKDVNGAVDSVVKGFERAGKGGSAVGSVLEGVSAGLGKMTGNVLGVQSGFDAMKNSFMGTVDMQKAMIGSGMLSAGQTADWGKKLAESGGNVQHFQTQLAKVQGSMTGLASNNVDAAKELLAFQKDFRESKPGKMFESMGMVPEQINEIATNALIRSQNLGLQDEKSRKEAIKSVGEFSMAMLNNAAVTNKTTDQLMRENAVRSEDLDVNLALLSGGKELNDSYRALKNVTGDLGSELQGSIDEIFAMGVVTEKAGNNLSAIGPAGTALGEAALALRNAKTEEQRKEGEQRLQLAKNNMDAYMRQQGPGGFAAQAQSQKYTDDAVGQSMRRIAGQELSRLQLQSTGAQQLGQRGPTTAGQVQTVRDFQASQMAANASGRTPDGAKAPGTEAFQNIVAADIAARNNFNKLQAAGYEKFSGAVDNFSKAVLMMPGAKAAKTGQEATPTEVRTPVEKPTPRVRLGGSPGLDDLLGNVKQETQGVPKGWMEALEKFDPNGEMVQLDGEEVVSNKKQWTAIGEALQSKMSGASSKKKESTAPKDAAGGMQNQLDTVVGKLIDGMPGETGINKTGDIKMPDFSKMPDITKMMGDIKMPDVSKMPDITKMMGDIKMPDVSKTLEGVAGKFGPDMFKPLTSGMTDMFKPLSNMSMPSTDGLFGGLKGMTAGLSSELGTKAAKTETGPAPATQEAAVPTGLPNQDMLAGLLEKLNTSVAGMGGLLQEGNQIAQSGNNQLASAADNRFTIG